MYSHESRVSIRYAETDAMAVVHHASYIIWFEVARTDWLKAQNYSYADFEKSGYYLVVTEIGVRYVRPARYGHDVIVKCYPAEVKSRTIRFQYEVRHADTDEVLVTGTSHHICTDHHGTVRKFPQHLLDYLSTAAVNGRET